MYKLPNKMNICMNNMPMLCGADNDLVPDKICALVLAISPILQHYKGFYQNAGFSALLLIFPYVLFKLWNKVWNSSIKQQALVSVIPLILFQIYRMIAGKFETTTVAYSVFFAVLYLAIAVGCINISFFVKCATYVGLAAGFLLVIQYISFYVVGSHIQLVPTSLLLPESSNWIAGAETGLISISGDANGFYRPCAFFLEPSHLFIYCFPLLCIWLLSPHMTNRKLTISVIITIAIVLSTSGMGLMVSLGLWGLYIFFYRSKDRKNIPYLHKLFTKENLYIMIVCVILLVILYTQVGVVQNSIDRIFNPTDSTNSTAIEGRTERAGLLIDKMSGSSILFGQTDDLSDINFNLPGFFNTLYRYGFIGLVLSYWYYVRGFFRLSGPFFWICFIIIVISFFTAHTHGTFYMLFYIIFLAEGYYFHNESPTSRLYRFVTR